MSREPTYVGSWLDPALAAALDIAAADARDTRAGFVRHLIAEALKVSGHLDATPRRHRAPRRQEGAQ